MLSRFSKALCRSRKGNINSICRLSLYQAPRTIENQFPRKINSSLSLKLNRNYSATSPQGKLSRFFSTDMTIKSKNLEFSTYKTLSISYDPQTFVATVSLNRPDRANAMNGQFWRECQKCFDEVGSYSEIRSIIINGNGKHFTAGLDLSDPGFDMSTLHNHQSGDSESDSDEGSNDVARKAFKLKKMVDGMQACFTAIEKCPQPVIAAISGACIGAGIDLITACDIRLCDMKSFFSIKEVQIGLAADVGTLQRIPKVIGNHSLMRELAYTGRNFNADECLKLGLVSEILEDETKLMERAKSLAEEIASQSPVAVYGTKINLNYARDHSVSDSLDYITTWNMAALQSADILKAGMAQMTKKKATFSKL